MKKIRFAFLMVLVDISAVFGQISPELGTRIFDEGFNYYDNTEWDATISQFNSQIDQIKRNSWASFSTFPGSDNSAYKEYMRPYIGLDYIKYQNKYYIVFSFKEKSTDIRATRYITECPKSYIQSKAQSFTYQNDGRTVTKYGFYAGSQKTRMYISGSYSDSWIIIEKAFCPKDDEYGEWENFAEYPIPYASNSELNDISSEITKNKINEDTENGIILEIVKNSSNGMETWWESRKYLCFLQRVYLILE